MKKFLIADDNEQNLYMLRALLEGHGYEVVSARNGAEALEAARPEPPDMIITDILMPVMDGFTLCSEWKSDERLKRIPLVFYTATYTDPKDEELALGLGADKFIVKPMDPGKFVEIIKGVIREAEKKKIKPKKPAPEKEKEIFKLYSERLVKKLEKKMLDLEKEVSNRKQVEEALGKSEERLRVLFEGTYDLITLTDANATTLWANPAWKNVFGEDLARRKDPFKLLHSDDRDKVARAWNELVMKKKAIRNLVYRFKAEDEEYRFFESSAYPVTIGGELLFYVVARDITERKQAEDELRRSKREWEDTFDAMSDWVSVTDLEARIVQSNQAGEKFTGVPLAGIVGQTCCKLVHGTDAPIPSCPLQKMLRTHHRESAELQVPVGDSWLLVTVDPVTDTDGNLVGAVHIARDITERKRSEEALRKISEEQAILLDNIDTQIWYLTDLENHGAVNRALAEFLGVQKSDIAYKNIYDILSKEEAEVCIAGNREVFESKRQVRTEEWVKNGRGELRLLSISKTPKLDKDGNVEYVVCAAEDITENKQVEEALRESEEKYRVILESIEDGYYEVDITGNFIFFNDSLCEIIGYTRDELMGMNNRHYMDGEIAKKVYQSYNKVYTTGKPDKGFEYEMIRKDGTSRNVEVSISLMKDSEGQGIGFRGIVRDVTKRKRTAEALKESEGRYRGLFENSTDFVFTLDLEGNFTDVNKAAELLTGYTRAELIGINNRDYTPKEAHKRIFQAFNRVFETGEPLQDFPLEVIVKDGSKKYFETSMTLLRKGDEIIGFQGSSRDITKRKRSEEKLKEYSWRLEQMVEEHTKELKDVQEKVVRQEKLSVLGQLAGGLGHELRNPLGAIKNTVYFLNTALKEPGPDIKEALGILNKEIETSEGVIKSLLDFARPAVPARRKVDVNDIVQAAMNRVPVPEKVQVVTRLNEALPNIAGDPEQLIQAFRNFIINAVQAMPEGGRLVIKSEAPSPESVTISFSDTGLGMEGETLAKVFEPLFTTKAKGIGLGLALTKMLVEAHGGKIEVQSKTGKGTTFTVSLPASGDK